MKIGVLGTGNIAAALCKGLAHKGYHVMIGSKDRETARNLAAEIGHHSKAGTVAGTVQYGEIIFLAVPYRDVESVLRNLDTYKGKVIVDTSNPILLGQQATLAMGFSTSGAEQIAAMIPEAMVVKAFNIGFAEHIESGPYFGSNDASMFYCSDSAEAKVAVAKVISDLGYEAIDAGPLNSARLLEPMATLLVRLATDQGMGRNIALKLLQRD